MENNAEDTTVAITPDQKLQLLNQGAKALQMALAIVSYRAMNFLAMFFTLFLFSWVMVQPTTVRVISASIGAAFILIAAKLNFKESVA